MKASESYQIEVDTMLEAFECAETADEALINKCFSLISRLRRSRWRGKYEARRVLQLAIDLHRRATRRLKLIQGGNEFIAKRSRANLTLIVNNETIDQTTSKGA